MKSRYTANGQVAGFGLRAAAAVLVSIVAMLAVSTLESQAQQRITLVNSTHTTTVNVMLGKSEDVRTDQGLVDITVGDPEIADVNPLTDHALSILGKKIGTTRVTVYGEGKKTVGIFDVEVSYDVSRLNAELARVAGSGIRVSTVNGRVLLSGTSPDAVTLDKVVQIAKQFVPDVINTVQVLQSQQIMLEVRFIEASRQASRELGVQWNMFGSGAVANVGNGVPAAQLPVTTPGSFTSQAPVGGLNVNAGAATISSAVASGVLSGAAPFGFLVGQLVGGKNALDVSINALEQKGLARSLAEPNLVALSGDTASFLAGGEFPVPVPGSLGVVSIDYKPYGVGLSFTPTVLKDGLINLVIKPEVSQLDTGNPVPGGGHFGTAADRRAALPPRSNFATARASCWRSVAAHQRDRPGPAAVGRRYAGARSAVSLQPVPEERDRPRYSCDAAHRAPDAADRTASYAARQQPAAQRHRLFPDGKTRGQPGAGAARRRRDEPAVCRPHPRHVPKTGDNYVSARN